MKSILTLFIVGALSVTGRADTDAVLRGIRIVETQDQLHPPRGKLGERGPYQFRRSTWRMHTSSSFALAENREVSNTVAKRHYAWIEEQLASRGVDTNPYNVALAWNAGVNAVIRGSAPAVARDYARRVINIASTFVAEAAEPAPKPAWQPPTITVDEAPQKPNLPPDSVTVEPEPVSVASTSTAVSETTETLQDDGVNVRYYSDPIMLALNRTTSEQPAGVTAFASNVSPEALVVASSRM